MHGHTQRSGTISLTDPPLTQDDSTIGENRNDNRPEHKIHNPYTYKAVKAMAIMADVD